jgi:hypothetical protein
LLRNKEGKLHFCCFLPSFRRRRREGRPSASRRSSRGPKDSYGGESTKHLGILGYFKELLFRSRFENFQKVVKSFQSILAS